MDYIAASLSRASTEVRRSRRSAEMLAWQRVSEVGQVAQLVEQQTENLRVGGSIPSLATEIWHWSAALKLSAHLTGRAVRSHGSRGRTRKATGSGTFPWVRSTLFVAVRPSKDRSSRRLGGTWNPGLLGNPSDASQGAIVELRPERRKLGSVQAGFQLDTARAFIAVTAEVLPGLPRSEHRPIEHEGERRVIDQRVGVALAG
jgi:hypothetical protein